MPFWRAHPIRLAALLGAIFGFLDVVVLEVRGVLHGGHSGAVPLFIPAPGGARLGTGEAAFVLLIELVANVLVWAVLFALPVAMIGLLVRGFRAIRRR